METKKKFLINAAFYGILAVLFFAFYRYILPILLPFIIGFCVASIVQLPLGRIRLKVPRHRRLLSCALVVVFYGLVVGLLVLFGSSIVREVGNLVRSLPDVFQQQIYPFFNYLADQVKMLLNPFDPKLTEWIIGLGKTIAQSLGQFATDLSAGAVKVVANSAISIPGILIHRQPDKPGHILPEIEDVPVFSHILHGQRRVYPVDPDGFAGTGTESTGRRGGIGHGVLPGTVVKGGQDPVFVVQPGVKMLPAPELVVDNGGLIGAFPAGIGGQHGFSVDFQRQNELRVVPPGSDIVVPGGFQVFIVPAVAALDGEDVVTLTKLFCDVIAVVP